MRVRKDAIVDPTIELDRFPGVAGVGASGEFDLAPHARPAAQAVGTAQLDLGLTRPAVLTRSAMRVKRALDVLAATLGLLALAPLIAMVAAAIKLEGGGAVFYRQLRVGHRGTRFEMLKFRTMVPGADAMKEALRTHNEARGGLFKIADDPRVTRVGRWLRRSALDELPQLLNILKGEMSLVGPRPLVIEEDERIAGRDRCRLELKPGMTGPWQILGPTRASLGQMVAIDYRYVEHWSLWKDLKILLRTVPHVLGRRGL
jgi:lipopolysaccharide/colanic/teichoic acid biosynthesis glycosyltransferase